MQELLEIAKYILPALVVLAAAYLVLNKLINAHTMHKSMEARYQIQRDALPIKLQAYERIIIFLERIAPSALILRVYKSGMSAKYLQNELINAIKSEFEHNLSQQIYVSNAAWEVTRNAKEEMIKFILTIGNKLDESSGGLELTKLLMDISANVAKLPTQIAEEVIKEEVRRYL
ncbi:MAG: hypothetical protein H7331_10860 [Bacteroidia bacterium]|nr:hypothetical protein [Bacteroidia bacterium]